MILVNGEEVKATMDALVSSGGVTDGEEACISLNRQDMDTIVSEAKEVVALVEQSQETLERIAQCIQEEIAFVKRLTPLMENIYAVAFSVSKDLLLSELSIASDMIRQETGDSPVKMALSYVDGDRQGISVIMGRK